MRLLVSVNIQTNQTHTSFCVTRFHTTCCAQGHWRKTRVTLRGVSPLRTDAGRARERLSDDPRCSSTQARTRRCRHSIGEYGARLAQTRNVQAQCRRIASVSPPLPSSSPHYSSPHAAAHTHNGRRPLSSGGAPAQPSSVPEGASARSPARSACHSVAEDASRD